MSIFNKFGYYIIKLFSLTGMLILSIPQIFRKLQKINSNDIKDRLDIKDLKNNISTIREDIKLDNKISYITSSNKRSNIFKQSSIEEDTPDNTQVEYIFSSKEKERTIFMLQVLSGIFVIMSIMSIFNFKEI